MEPYCSSRTAVAMRLMLCAACEVLFVLPELHYDFKQENSSMSALGSGMGYILSMTQH